MKRFLVAVILGVFSATGAFAADMAPVYKARPATIAERAYNWTGFYVGAHVGHLTGHTSNDTNGILPNGTADAWFAGVQGGYRYQFDNNLVLGLQISAPLTSNEQVYSVFGNLNHVDVKYSVLGQIQLGYAYGRLLPYLSAGIGQTKVEAWEVPVFGPESNHVTNTHTLYALGFGMKYGVTEHVSVGLGYNHTWTSREPYDCGPASCNPVGSFDFRGDTVSATVDYRF